MIMESLENLKRTRKLILEILTLCKENQEATFLESFLRFGKTFDNEELLKAWTELTKEADKEMIWFILTNLLIKELPLFDLLPYDIVKIITNFIRFTMNRGDLILEINPLLGITINGILAEELDLKSVIYLNVSKNEELIKTYTDFIGNDLSIFTTADSQIFPFSPRYILYAIEDKPELESVNFYLNNLIKNGFLITLVSDDFFKTEFKSEEIKEHIVGVMNLHMRKFNYQKLLVIFTKHKTGRGTTIFDVPLDNQGKLFKAMIDINNWSKEEIKKYENYGS